jgi:hypothetical protein
MTAPRSVPLALLAVALLATGARAETVRARGAAAPGAPAAAALRDALVPTPRLEGARLLALLGLPVPAPPPWPSEVLDALRTKALWAREAAANPTLRPDVVGRHLETAARALLRARRTLNALDAQTRDALAPVDEEVRELLVATWLDLAALLREAGDLAAAGAHVRAALLLDPGNEEALAAREGIRADLARLAPDPFDPWGPTVLEAWFLPGPWLGYGLGRRVHPHAGSRGGTAARAGGYAPKPGASRATRHGPSRRVVGTRRFP